MMLMPEGGSWVTISCSIVSENCGFMSVILTSSIVGLMSSSIKNERGDAIGTLVTCSSVKVVIKLIPSTRSPLASNTGGNWFDRPNMLTLDAVPKPTLSATCIEKKSQIVSVSGQ